jgi:replication-associated recombination protein RarA
MIPDTKNGLPAMACVSAMQKAIRRGLEREAMEFACELMHTSKAFHAMVCNRLEVICHEDLDTLAAPHVFPFVAASLAASDGGQCDPRDVPLAEVSRWLSLRCGHRASVHA